MCSEQEAGMIKTKSKVLMKDVLLSGRQKEKTRISLRCSQCGRFVFFGMMLNGLCEKCADRVLAEVSVLLQKEKDTSFHS